MQHWTEPVLSPKNPKASDIKKEWRVRFKYFYRDKWYPITLARDVNRIHDFKQRLREINELKNAIRHKLEFQFWNPVTNTYHNERISKNARAGQTYLREDDGTIQNGQYSRRQLKQPLVVIEQIM